MGMFNRISNIFSAKANGALDGIENPIEMLDQKLRDMDESLNTAKVSSAQVLGNCKETEKKIAQLTKESGEWEVKVKLAMSKGNEDLAKKALAKKIDADKELASLETIFTEQTAKCDKLKAGLKDLQNEIEKTRRYRDEASARMSNADASKKVNEIMANVNTKSNSINIDDIERKIAKKEAMAEGLGDLKEPTLNDEFAQLEEVNLDAELEKYKTK